MMKRNIALFALLLTLTASSLQAADKDWTDMFDGKTLNGWAQKNGTATYRPEHKTIVGRTAKGSPNSFLCSKKEYGDFELLFEVKVDDALNSGVQIRSRSIKEKNNGRVHGPQVEIATNGTAGFIYGEGLSTGWLSEDREDAKKKAAFKNGKWNKYRVLASGKNIKTWINGIAIADLTDNKTDHAKGFIGLQVHGVGNSGPYEVRWRNIKIRELSKK